MIAQQRGGRLDRPAASHEVADCIHELGAGDLHRLWLADRSAESAGPVERVDDQRDCELDETQLHPVAQEIGDGLVTGDVGQLLGRGLVEGDPRTGRPDHQAYGHDAVGDQPGFVDRCRQVLVDEEARSAHRDDLALAERAGDDESGARIPVAAPVAGLYEELEATGALHRAGVDQLGDVAGPRLQQRGAEATEARGQAEHRRAQLLAGGGQHDTAAATGEVTQLLDLFPREGRRDGDEGDVEAVHTGSHDLDLSPEGLEELDQPLEAERAGRLG
ncbi:MAG: hypothetical protein EDR02_15900 [Actinobacteria bacterium]|nr:MAG: hypothetical protein EDR02_15900 [Actinomycetota bacterium]RIK03949.1 MAG: hypothetical protein DCC48_14680 [Acidobacteriota bacterium]